MTLGEIIDLAIVQAGLDVDDRDEYVERMTIYVNDGYMRLMLEKYKPWVEETVTIADEELSWDELERTPLELMQVSQDDVVYPAVLREDTRTIEVEGVDDGEILIRYRYKPLKLEFEEDAPKLPEWAHTALADWATYRWLFGGNQSKQARAQAFRMAFEEKFRYMRPYSEDVATRKQFVNLYR